MSKRNKSFYSGFDRDGTENCTADFVYENEHGRIDTGLIDINEEVIYRQPIKEQLGFNIPNGKK